MAVSGVSGGGQVLSLDSLVRLRRGMRTSAAPRRLPVPEGMTAPLGCDAVAVPARFGPLVLPRLPRVGCVYADDVHWWWILPSDSDYALEWPTGVRYSTGAVVMDTPRLIHRGDGTVPYTPPIPLYLALCRVMGTTPTWSKQITA
ncbi:hypothetical protein PGH47_10715 [Streptomyces sp. HUAS 31]|jgi:hypothetical protein|uniref:Uncharacterized protein n=1 Tax=Streptomyces osmaniensis TaxID=593134 RepID=A0ABP6WXM5_9ACTN|nr:MULTISPECIES: hypothetical protein [Streptomyces]QWA21762.1 hypothetical protein KJK32_11785 [Streptomyces sp. JCM17656]WCD96114.1 hypothetical protein PGH47_10715 [Streptomyces sp. HUAS 31]WSZ70420.1 hypothetical protein OG938_33050 [Streptomyces chartreusis]WTA26599.1 hypothetical protein OIA45_11520 [Streptomyces chartreusis]WUB17243.1 hypothetical protein OG997_11220 [Streptomyces chartreusis]